MVADAATLEGVIRGSAMAWMELRGEVIDLHKRPLRYPDLVANFIQRQEEEILDWMEANGCPGRLIKLKGRRQGSSTGSLARGAHRCRKKTTGALICGLDYSKNCKVMKRIFDHFVSSDRHEWGMTVDRKVETTAFGNGSSVELLSANTGNAARGEGYQWVLMTEVSFYPDTDKRSAQDFVTAVFQCVPREPGTEIIMESTPNGEGGMYHGTWTRAIHFEDLKAGRIPENWNGFVKLFYPWHIHPEYRRDCSPAERDKIMSTLSDREQEMVSEFPHIDAERLKWRREVLSGEDFQNDEDKFEIEYPSDEYRCFAGTGRKRFDWKAIKAMLDIATDGESGVVEWGPDERAVWIPADEKDSWLRLWEKPIHGCKYSLIVDPMTGEQANGPDPDNHAPGVMRDAYIDTNGRWHPPALVARMADCWAEIKAAIPLSVHCRWALDVLEERIARVSKMFGGCQIVVEMNKDLGLVELLKLRGWCNLYMRETFNHREQKTLETVGWMTTPAGTGQRRAILEGLSVAIRCWNDEGKGIEIRDRRVLTELARMIVKETGREEAGPGCHDDTVMMLAIGLATIGKATTYFSPAARVGFAWRNGQGQAMDRTFSD